jgi:hypothetical protein
MSGHNRNVDFQDLPQSCFWLRQALRMRQRLAARTLQIVRVAAPSLPACTH